jgi:hypothetical protein
LTAELDTGPDDAVDTPVCVGALDDADLGVAADVVATAASTLAASVNAPAKLLDAEASSVPATVASAEIELGSLEPTAAPV